MAIKEAIQWVNRWVRLFTAALLLGWATQAHAAVWETKNQWDENWEKAYGAWVEKEWDAKFFTKNTPLKNSIVDCADTVYAMRTYFASQNGLPFVMKDPTTRAGKLVSNEMTRWDAKPQDQRVRSFIQYIFGLASTASLPADTYPVAISRATLGSGSMAQTDAANHHSWTVKKFSETGIPHLVFGSRPARTLLYDRYEFPNRDFIFPRGIRAETNAGFKNFRQPSGVGLPVSQVPGFSLEQYQIPANGWAKAMQKKMQTIEETAEQRAQRILTEACKGAKERVENVTEGVKFNDSIGARCMNAQEYDDYSTPNRDSRMKATFQDLADAFKSASNGKNLSNKTRSQIQSVLSGQASAINAAATCVVQVSPTLKLTLGQIYDLSIGDKLSNNPHDPLSMRWGQEKGPSAKAKSCPVY